MSKKIFQARIKMSHHHLHYHHLMSVFNHQLCITIFWSNLPNIFNNVMCGWWGWIFFMQCNKLTIKMRCVQLTFSLKYFFPYTHITHILNSGYLYNKLLHSSLWMYGINNIMEWRMMSEWLKWILLYNFYDSLVMAMII